MESDKEVVVFCFEILAEQLQRCDDEPGDSRIALSKAEFILGKDPKKNPLDIYPVTLTLESRAVLDTPRKSVKRLDSGEVLLSH